MNLEKMMEARLSRLVGIIRAISFCVVGLSLAHVHAAAPQPPVEEVLPEGIEKFVVKTSNPENREVPFYVRVPANYRQHPEKKLYRVLFTCPIFSLGGLKNLTGESGLMAIADERDWFMVSPTFKQGKEDVQDRKLSYYYPETFSGKAVQDALNLIRQKYPIATDGLLLHGLSAGAQFVHRFAIWAPEQVAAVAVDSASWFDDPNPRCERVGWLVTVGEADPSYENTLEFVAKLKKVAADPVYRSYLGMLHGREAKVPQLDIEFLKFCDDLTRNKMGTFKPSMFPPKPEPILPVFKMPFVGDAQKWRYYKNTPETVEGIPEDSRVFLPSEAIAKEWGSSTGDKN